MRNPYFENKKILITGGSRGIGLEIVKLLLNENAIVHSIARKQPALTHSNLVNIKADLYQGIPDIDKEYDIVILNIGVNPGQKTFSEYSVEEMRRTIFLNLNVHLEILKKVSCRKVVFIDSILSFIGCPNNSLYCACKSFISTFNESLRREGKDTYIIYPGKVDTDLFSEIETSNTLDKTELANTIVNDIRCGRKTRIIPIFYNLIGLLKLLLPNWLLDWIVVKATKKATKHKSE